MLAAGDDPATGWLAQGVEGDCDDDDVLTVTSEIVTEWTITFDGQTPGTAVKTASAEEEEDE